MPGLWRMQNGEWVTIVGATVQPPPPPTGEITDPPYWKQIGSQFASQSALTAVAWPAHEVGDIGILVVETAAQTIGAVPSGWAHITGSPFTVGTAGAAGSVGVNILWRRAATNNEPAANIGDSGDHQIARIFTLGNCVDTGNPWDVIASDTVGTAATAVTVPSVTTTVIKTLVMLFVGNGVDTGTNPGPDTYTNANLTGLVKRASIQSGLGFGGGVSWGAGVKEAAGSTGTTTGTLSTASNQVRVAVAFKAGAGTAPPPPTGGVFRTMHAGWGLDDALLGTAPVPDMCISDSSPGGWVNTGGHIDDLVAAGAAGGGRLTQGNQTFGAPGPYNHAAFLAQCASFIAGVKAISGGETKLRNAVASGNFRFWMVLDDFVGTGGDNGFSVPPTYLQIEDACAQIKNDWPWMPLVARGLNTSLKNLSKLNGVVRPYQYLDAGWAQWRKDRAGDTIAVDYFTREVQAGIDCDLGLIGGANLLNGGTGGVSGWGCRVANNANLCAMAPSEVLEAGAAVASVAGVHGLIWWSYQFGTSYWLGTAIQAALTTVNNGFAGRNDPAINIRGDLTPA